VTSNKLPILKIILEYPYSLLLSGKGYYNILIILKYLKIIRRISYTLNKSVTLGGLSPTLRKGILAYSNLRYKDSLFFNYIIELLKIKEITIYLIFKIYNTLFNYFFKVETLLKYKPGELISFPYNRLFNIIRDIYYYYYSRLKSEIIEELILFLYIIRFNIKDIKDTKLNLISNNKEEEGRRALGRKPIAILTRDTLSFLVTSVGVKRLFNTARDICYYRRSRIKLKTIKDLIIFLYTLRFDIEE
ncbi:hypothetical protein N7516_005895, partial [Penicillium verrucosum]|uniref:uncharacterized protein n=1 Tax=Penicillium verrucosum TaxID=60171 RepID=UPI002545A657